MMAALLSIGGALHESSVTLFLVPYQKVQLMPTAQGPCSNAANTAECKTGKQSEFCTLQKSVTGQEPPKCIYSTPAQEMAKHCAKFGWPPVTDVAVVMKPRCKTC